ncbi:hypothetical protein VB776_08160 [Arcicella sp. DC2W]|uniref:SD-repeat containing protein B domain-containing protein n=1 Tax=Arcicella gelida TaxID=2984195 RepID=A0ABU5S332_9BACT|nr:hypothetical protein [Arcicella sp. DC2W]MEA5402884.1 hypothetical protein [Arcicella sp. DC2W]
MSKYIKILALLIFICSVAHAQQGKLFGLTTANTNILANNEERVVILLKLSNYSEGTLNGRIAITADAGLTIISKNDFHVNVAPHDSSFVSVSIFVTKKAKAGVANAIKFVLYDEHKNKLAAVASEINVSPKRKVNLYAAVSSILLDNLRDTILIPVQVFNSGNTVQAITLVCTYPLSIDEQGFHQNIKLTLPASTDTTIVFSKPITKRMLNIEAFDINITGVYANGDVVGNALVQVQSARSTRNYRDELSSSAFTDNTLQIGSQNLFNSNQSYLVRGRGGFELGKDRLSYSLNLSSWQNRASPILIQNTWLEYGNKQRGIKVGNIFRSLDLNLTGRGVMGYLSTSKTDTWEVGFIDKENNLLGRQNNQINIGGSRAGWIAFKHQDKQWRTNHFFVLDYDGIQGVQNQLLGNEFQYTSNKKMVYGLNLNGGRVSSLQNSNVEKYGMSMTVNVNGAIGKVNINSSNYLSTGYYPGLQRGALNLSERVNWSLPKANIWWFFNFRNFSPKQISPDQFVFATRNLRAEWGVSLKSKKVAISLAPVFTHEKGNPLYSFIGEARQQSLNAWNALFNFSLPSAKNQSFFMNSEMGAYSLSSDSTANLHLRTNLYYKNGIFNLNGSIQLGAFYLSEIPNSAMGSTKQSNIFNFASFVQKSWFSKKLKTNTGISFTYHSNFGSSQFLTERMEYVAGDKTSIYTNLNLNRYNNRQRSILELGLIHHFPTIKVNVKSSNLLEVFVYKDLNQDGVYSKTDSIAGGLMVNIDKKLFITDKSGNIIYKNLPDGIMTVSVPYQQGWHAPEQKITLQKKTKIGIPLQITGTLKGQLSYVRSQFSYETDIDLFGIVMLAVDKTGKVFRTRTSSDGRYAFYMPLGEYKVSVDTSLLSSELEVPNNGKDIKIENGNITTTDFIIKVKQRKIEIKKFTSPSVSPSNK